MARILAIDYGMKRTGLAVTDPLQIIATALDTVPTKDLMDYLKAYMAKEEVEAIVIGYPLHLDDSRSHMTEAVEGLEKKLKKQWPNIAYHFEDERFTSKQAAQVLVASGMKKKNRQKKENLDKVSAVLILQAFMERSS